MPIIRERKLFMLAVTLLNTIQDGVLSSHRIVAYETLSLLVGTEDFDTFRAEYIGSTADVELLIAFKVSCLDEFKRDPEKRRFVRPLCDCIDRAMRLHKLK